MGVCPRLLKSYLSAELYENGAIAHDYVIIEQMEAFVLAYEEAIALSFDIMVFDKTKTPKFFEDFLNWSVEQTKWTEDRDYNLVDGTSPQLEAWFREMKETFPPLNGPYSLSDEEIFANEEIENRLTDYSIGSSVIYAAFGWSVAEEAVELAVKLAKKHDVGFFDPQTADIHCEGMVACKMRTESHDDKTVTWEQIEREVFSLDDSERGTSPFITIFFEENGIGGEFMQCSPDYPKREGFINKLFGSSKSFDAGIIHYTIEVCTGSKIFSTQASGKEQVIEIFRNYYSSRQLPDVSAWHDTGII